VMVNKHQAHRTVFKTEYRQIVRTSRVGDTQYLDEGDARRE